MKKKLFLSIFTLAGICSAIYCADDAPIPGLFQPNIYLPLQGEALDRYDNALDPEYANTLGILGSIMISSGTSCGVVGMGYAVAGISTAVASISTAMSAGVVAGLRCNDFINQHSRETIRDHNHTMGGMIDTHNLMVGGVVPVNVNIHINKNENKVLEIQYNGMIENHMYPFSANLQKLEKATRLRNMILLGPGNIDRIKNVVEKVGELDKQLVPIRNTKRAIRG